MRTASRGPWLGSPSPETLVRISAVHLLLLSTVDVLPTELAKTPKWEDESSPVTLPEAGEAAWLEEVEAATWPWTRQRVASTPRLDNSLPDVPAIGLTREHRQRCCCSVVVVVAAWSS